MAINCNSSYFKELLLHEHAMFFDAVAKYCNKIITRAIKKDSRRFPNLAIKFRWRTTVHHTIRKLGRTEALKTLLEISVFFGIIIELGRLMTNILLVLCKHSQVMGAIILTKDSAPSYWWQ